MDLTCVVIYRKFFCRIIVSLVGWFQSKKIRRLVNLCDLQLIATNQIDGKICTSSRASAKSLQS